MSSPIRTLSAQSPFRFDVEVTRAPLRPSPDLVGGVGPVDINDGEILPVALADMQRAFDLAHSYRGAITTRDAVHAATVPNNGLAYVASADSHFDAIDGITRVAPNRGLRRAR
jgi:hypothetical protein